MKTRFWSGCFVLVISAWTALWLGCSNAKTLLYEYDSQIQKQHEDGTGPAMLASKGQYPAWIPGVKTHIAYVEKQSGTIPMKLWVAEEDGKNPVALTGFEVQYAYSWSPDGDWIAVAHTKHGIDEIYKLKVDKTAAVRLTSNTVVDHFPAWSPKGDRIAFISNRSGTTSIFVVDADGKNEKQVTPNTLDVDAGLTSQLSWSGDGKSIAFVGSWSPDHRVATVDVQTGKITQLTGKGVASRPLWFESYVFYFVYNDLFRHDVSSGKESNLGHFVPESPHSNLTANAAYVFFSYRSPGAKSPHIHRVQHYTGGARDLGPGAWPDVW